MLLGHLAMHRKGQLVAQLHTLTVASSVPGSHAHLPSLAQ